ESQTRIAVLSFSVDFNLAAQMLRQPTEAFDGSGPERQRVTLEFLQHADSPRRRTYTAASVYCEGTWDRKCNTSLLNCSGSCKNEKWLTCGSRSRPAPGMLSAINSVFSRLIASSWSASTIQVGTLIV